MQEIIDLVREPQLTRNKDSWKTVGGRRMGSKFILGNNEIKNRQIE